MRTRFLFLLFILPLLTGGCKESRTKKFIANSEINICFDYERQPGPGGNQWAIWVEDSEQNIVKTLFVTRFTATGGYVPRPSCTPLWVKKAQPADLSQETIDAYTGATPPSGLQTCVWDLTGADGETVSAGTYVIMLEATLLNDSEAIYKIPVTVGNKHWSVAPEPFFTSEDATNKQMIRSVSVAYLLKKTES